MPLTYPSRAGEKKIYIYIYISLLSGTEPRQKSTLVALGSKILGSVYVHTYVHTYVNIPHRYTYLERMYIQYSIAHRKIWGTTQLVQAGVAETTPI